MEQKPIILVTGATGAQGGNVANTLLKENKFAVRAFTRNAHSAGAQTLKQLGAEIFEGTMDDVESMKKAMEGCYGVYGVTNFWEHFGKEFQLGKNLVDAVHQSGIKHFVFSTMANYHQLSQGKYEVLHCDIKGKLQDYAISLGLPATFVHMPFYYENFFSFFPLQPGGDGNYYFGFPQGDTKLAMVSVEDMGPVVARIFDYPVEYIGRIAGIVGDDRTCAEYAAIMSKVLGQNIYYNYIPRAEYAAYGFPGAEELANMFEVQRLHIPNRQLHLIETYGLHPGTQTFESWVKKNQSKFAKCWEKEEAVLAN